MRNQKNKGITLIALVITIIVLVILVGVSVSVAINTGLIANSKTAVEDYDKAQTEEKSRITEVEDIVAAYSSDNIMASKVTPANYGDTITGYIDLDSDGDDTDDWQIFSVEGNNVWLVSKEYVQLDESTAAGVGMATGYKKCVYWNNVPDYGKTCDNGNCAASLADTSKWTVYVDENYALKAMGGPTIEMFANSYNAKYETTLNKTIMYDANGTYGYKLKWSTKSIWNVFDYETDRFPMNDFYINNPGGAFGYYLAGAYSEDQSSIWGIASAGANRPMYSSIDYDEGHGLRPVVCLKSNVVFTEPTTEKPTTWSLGGISE